MICPDCEGDGLDGSNDAARFYAYSGKLTSCDRCDGTGIVDDYPSVTHDPDPLNPPGPQGP